MIKKGFDEYYLLSGCTYHADTIIEKVKKTYEEIDKPKYLFLLFMETHQPYPHRKGLTEEYLNQNYRSIKRQMKSVEALDKDFEILRKYLKGTNTDILVFSDHGDLDGRIEGYQGHGPGLFHPKLFEIPLGRNTV